MLGSRPVALNGDGPQQYVSKTPGKALHKTRSTLQENALHQGARTVGVKSYKASFQTPMRDDTLKPQKLFTVAQSSKGGVTNTVSRPLLDKTPFPNRQRNALTPIPSQDKKTGKLPAFDQHLSVETSGHLLRPSSTRKSVRGRRSSTNLNLQTPVGNGNHWDVSELEIEVPVAGDVQQEEAHAEDYDEIEYMPPTAIEEKYEPPFEMPDYNVAGAQLFKLMHSYTFDDRNDVYFKAERERMDEGLLEASGFSLAKARWDYFDLPELEDESPFSKPPPVAPKSLPQSKASNKIPASAPARQAAFAKPAPRAPVQAASTSTLGARSASTRLPTHSAPPAKATSRVRSSTVVAPAAPPLVRPARSNTVTSKPPPRALGTLSRPTVARPATSASLRPVVPASGTKSHPASTATERPATSASTRTPAKPSLSLARPTKPVIARVIAGKVTATARPQSAVLPRTIPRNARTTGSGKAEPPNLKASDDLVLVFEDGGVEDDEGFTFDV